METEGARTDRLGLPLDQFDHAGETAQVRLTGLSDEEFLWEPMPSRRSIRRRGEATTPRAFGPGAWVLDQGAPDLPASECAEVARQAADGMTVAKIAADWSVRVERVARVLVHTGAPEPDEPPITTIRPVLDPDVQGRGRTAYLVRRLRT